VKLRGFRIELGEIEAALSSHPLVREAAVIVQDDRPENRRLVAYVVPDGDHASNGDLRDFLEQRLPEYMVPSVFARLERLPLTVNGKLDRRALPAPEADRPVHDDVDAAPHSETDEIISGIWKDVLQVERIGLNDNFFDLGGTSLLAMRIQIRLQDALKREVPIVSLFQFPTVRALGRHLMGDGEASSVSDNGARAERQRAAFGRVRLGRKGR
jgi:acyl carrier protein